MNHRNKTNRRAHIGFDRRIDREWLDATALQAAANISQRQMRGQIRAFLNTAYPDQKNAESAQKKTATVLHHIWGQGRDYTAGLHHRATTAFASATSDEQLALHWAMMIATYPIFSDVVTVSGCILSLQDTFTFSHLHHRLIEMWGKRSTLERAVQRILRSMVQWGVLEDTKKRGTYQGISQKKTIRPDIAILLLEALLMDTEQDSMSLPQLFRHSALFPFAVDIPIDYLRQAPQFRVHRYGLDTDYLELHELVLSDSRLLSVSDNKSF